MCAGHQLVEVREQVDKRLLTWGDKVLLKEKFSHMCAIIIAFQIDQISIVVGSNVCRIKRGASESIDLTDLKKVMCGAYDSWLELVSLVEKQYEVEKRNLS